MFLVTCFSLMFFIALSSVCTFEGGTNIVFSLGFKGLACFVKRVGNICKTHSKGDLL